jgi:hypothetical protein
MAAFGELFIKVAADIAELKDGMDKSVYLAEQASQRMEASFQKVTKSLIGVAAGLASLGTIKAFAGHIEDAITAEAAMARVATKTQMSVEAISGLSKIAKLSGSSLDEVSAAALKFNKSLSDATTGSGKQYQAFKDLGLSGEEVAAGLKHPEEMLVKVAQRINAFADGAGKTQVEMALFSKAGGDMDVVLRGIADAGKLAGSVTTEQARAAEELEKQIKRLEMAKGALYRRIANDMVPALSTMIELYVEWKDKALGVADAHAKLQDTTGLENWAARLAQVFAVTIDAMGMGWKFLNMVYDTAKMLAGELVSLALIIAGVNEVMAGRTKDGLALIDKGVENSKAVWAGYYADVTARAKTFTSALDETTGRLRLNAALAASARGDFDDARDRRVKGPSGDGRPALPDRAKVDEVTKAYDSLMETLGKTNAELNAQIDSWEKEGRELKSTREAAVEYEVTLGKLKNTTTAQKQAALDAARGEDAKKAWLDRRRWFEDQVKKQTDEENADYDAKLKWQADEFTKAMREMLDDKTKADASYIGSSELRALSELEIEKRKWERIIALYEDGDERKRKLQERYTDWLNSKQVAIEVKEFQKVWDSVDKFAEDAFLNIVNNGESGFKRLTDTLKNTLLKLLYEMTVKQWIFQIFANVSGQGNAAGAAASAVLGGDNNLMSGASTLASLYQAYTSGSAATGTGTIATAANFYNGLTTGASVYAPGTAGYYGSAINGYANAQFGGVGQMAGAYLGSAAVGGAIGYFGAGALGAGQHGQNVGAGAGAVGAMIGTYILPGIGTLIGAAIGALAGYFTDPDGLAQRTGVFGQITPNSHRVEYAAQSPFGAFGISDTHWFNQGEMGDALKTLLSAMSQIETGIAPLLNKGQFTAVQQALSGSREYNFGTEHGDFSHGVEAVFYDRISAIVDTVAPHLHNLVAQFKGTSLELANSIQALIAIDLGKFPESLKELVRGFVGTGAQLDTLVQSAMNVGLLYQRLDVNPLEDFAKILENGKAGLFGALHRNGDAILELASLYDGSTEATQQFMALTEQRYQMEMELLAQVQNALEAVAQSGKDAMRSMTIATLDNPAHYAFLEQEIQGFMDVVASSLDPKAIQEASQHAIADIQEAFGLLSKDEQTARLQEFLDAINRVTGSANARLGSIQETVGNEANVNLPESIASHIKDALDKWVKDQAAAIAAQQQAAFQQEVAAGMQLDAARTPLHIVIHQDVATEVGSG